MFDVARLKIFVPVLDQLGRQKVRLVDQQHELLFVAADVLDVLLEVGGVEELGVSGIHNLDEHVRFLDDAPKLSPDFDVLFEGSNCEIDGVLLLGCDVATPLEERYVFTLSDLLSGHALLPGWAPRDLQVLVATTSDNVFKRASRSLDEIIDESRSVRVSGGARSWHDLVARNQLWRTALSYELSLRQIGELHELVERTLLQDRAQLGSSKITMLDHSMLKPQKVRPPLKNLPL